MIHRRSKNRLDWPCRSKEASRLDGTRFQTDRITRNRGPLPRNDENQKGIPRASHGLRLMVSVIAIGGRWARAKPSMDYAAYFDAKRLPTKQGVGSSNLSGRTICFDFIRLTFLSGNDREPALLRCRAPRKNSPRQKETTYSSREHLL